ncbi:hypothetical protein ACFQH6_17820 [Halobacteriaceae archaeon GCM10025711]
MEDIAPGDATWSRRRLLRTGGVAAATLTAGCLVETGGDGSATTTVAPAEQAMPDAFDWLPCPGQFRGAFGTPTYEEPSAVRDRTSDDAWRTVERQRGHVVAGFDVEYAAVPGTFRFGRPDDVEVAVVETGVSASDLVDALGGNGLEPVTGEGQRPLPDDYRFFGGELADVRLPGGRTDVTVGVGVRNGTAVTTLSPGGYTPRELLDVGTLLAVGAREGDVLAFRDSMAFRTDTVAFLESHPGQCKRVLPVGAEKHIEGETAVYSGDTVTVTRKRTYVDGGSSTETETVPVAAFHG